MPNYCDGHTVQSSLATGEAQFTSLECFVITDWQINSALVLRLSCFAPATAACHRNTHYTGERYSTASTSNFKSTLRRPPATADESTAPGLPQAETLTY